ncbi:hypothetical protein MLD52_16315 [Puniceicoccaceae bacterium K14]|nr:hypothetical protein [Puniceicoccaceae bacterium K14]
MEEIEYLGTKIRRWKIGSSTFLAAPEMGARLMNWSIDFPDGGFRNLIHWPELDSLDKFVKARGGNPILFPFSARTFESGEIGFWKDLKGIRRPMPMHGFARQGEFEITRIDKTGFACSLKKTDESKEAYPYEYDFEVIYRFSQDSVTVELRLKNLDTQPIPWSAGHHFYFNLPWTDDTSRKDYEIEIPAKKACRQNPDGSLNAVPKAKSTELISNKNLVDRIHYHLTSPNVVCRNKRDGSTINIEIGTNKLPNSEYALVTWTETDKSPFYCIEPWMGPPSAPENKIGLHTVTPGETHAFSVTIRT